MTSVSMPAPDNSGPGPGGVPRASLICRPNSHPFQDRMLGLDQPVKVGRSVARARPLNTNAIFDCKVCTIKINFCFIAVELPNQLSTMFYCSRFSLVIMLFCGMKMANFTSKIPSPVMEHLSTTRDSAKVQKSLQLVRCAVETSSSLVWM